MSRRRHSRPPLFKFAAIAAAGLTTLSLAGMHAADTQEMVAPAAPPTALAHIAERNRDAATAAAARRREAGLANAQAADAQADSHDRAVASARP